MKSILVFVTLLLSNFGCATHIATFSEKAPDNKIYSGTRAWVSVAVTTNKHRKKDNGFLFFAALIDAPLCLVYDTVLLPYTIFDYFFPNKKTVDVEKCDDENEVWGC